MPRDYLKPICSVEDCGRPALARSLCSKHYQRQLRYGRLTLERTERGAALRWLQNAVATRDRSEGCWEWPFSRHEFGYGELRFRGAHTHAPSVALILDGKAQPPAPANHALHSCDNPPCCNPDHLRWGSPADNHVEMVAKRRHPHGSHHYRASLTESQIPAIRKDGRRSEEIGRDYGVTRKTIDAIKIGRTWKHVP